MPEQVVAPPFRNLFRMPLPAILLFGSVVVNSWLQLAFSDSSWSPFELLQVQLSPMLGSFYFAIGVAIFIGSGLRLRGAKAPQRGWGALLDSRRLKSLTLALLVTLVVVLFIAQWSLGDANAVNLLLGHAVALDVENALSESPFGIHGFGLILAYAVLTCWHVSRMCRCSDLTFSIALSVAIIYFLSNGKAQGIVYVVACYFLQPSHGSRAARTLLGVAVVALLFVFTRIIRNQGSGLELDVTSVAKLAVGFYFGSPVANTSHIAETGLQAGNLSVFFANLIPQKLSPTTVFFAQLPDPTSPLGLAGSAMMLGGYIPALVYGLAVGYMVEHFYLKSFSRMGYRIFLPFLLVACVFAMMYNHFMNLTFFWIPLLICMLICKYVFRIAKHPSWALNVPSHNQLHKSGRAECS